MSLNLVFKALLAGVAAVKTMTAAEELSSLLSSPAFWMIIEAASRLHISISAAAQNLGGSPAGRRSAGQSGPARVRPGAQRVGSPALRLLRWVVGASPPALCKVGGTVHHSISQHHLPRPKSLPNLRSLLRGQLRKSLPPSPSPPSSLPPARPFPTRRPLAHVPHGLCMWHVAPEKSGLRNAYNTCGSKGQCACRI